MWEKIKHKCKRIPEVLREWIWLFRYIKRYRWSVVLYILLGIVATIMGLVVSVASKDLINAVNAMPKVKEDIIRAAATMIGLAIGQISFQSCASWVTVNVNTKVTNEIRSEIFLKIMTAQWENLRDFHSGELLNRLEGDVGSVVSGVINFMPSLVTSGVRFVGALIIIMWYDPMMAVFALASAPILVFSSRPLMKFMRKYSEKTREINGKILSFNEEAFQNIQLVKAFNLTRQRYDALCVLLTEHRRMRLEYSKTTIWVNAAMSLIGLVAGYACYGWAVYRLYTGKIDFGTMTLFLQMSSTLSGAFGALVGLVPTAVSTATSVGRVIEVTTMPDEPDADAEPAQALVEKAKTCGVSVKGTDITFAYKDAEAPVMAHVGFEAHPGEIVAFVGPSGGGKTTVLRMMLGLLTPQEGALHVASGDGEIDLKVSDSTRRLCAYVPQGNSVFSGTIEDNLRAVNPDVTEEQIEEALRVADAWKFVSETPDGIRTVLGERGVNFSEGQLQRLSIARAILRDAPVLIMDEATSALDTDTEERVLKNLMKSSPTRVCLITTHRASMLNYADRIYKVNGEGQFEEQAPIKCS